MSVVNVLDNAIDRLVNFDFDNEVEKNLPRIQKEYLNTYKQYINNLYSIVKKIKNNRVLINEYIEEDFTKEINSLHNILIDLQNISQNTTDNQQIITDRIKNIFEHKKNENDYKNVNPFSFHYKNLIYLATSSGVLNNKVDNFTTQLSKVENDAKNILTNMQSVSAEIGVHIHYKSFEKIAEEYKLLSKKWLRTTIILAIFLAVLLIGFFIYYFCSGNDKVNYNLISIKLVFFTALFTATIWSGNKYKILCHLHVVNLHKAISLQTFKTFVDAADKEDKEIRNAVLLECTKTIFVTPETGYIKTEDKNSGTNIIEVMKNFKSG